MSDVVYRSRIHIERQRGPNRLAWLPGQDEPIRFGVHSEIAEHYGVEAEDFGAHAATLDYLVAATGG